jgi:hypothetical protein
MLSKTLLDYIKAALLVLSQHAEKLSESQKTQIEQIWVTPFHPDIIGDNCLSVTQQQACYKPV